MNKPQHLVDFHNNSGLLAECALVMVGPYGLIDSSEAQADDIALRFETFMMGYFNTRHFEIPHSDMLTLQFAMENKLRECLPDSYHEDEKQFLIKVVLRIFSAGIDFRNMTYNVLFFLTLSRKFSVKSRDDKLHTVFKESEQLVRELKIIISERNSHTFESWRSEVQNIIPLLPVISRSRKHTLDDLVLDSI